MFREIKGMIDDLNTTNSNNEKQEILKKYDKEVFKKALFYTYFDGYQFYVKPKSFIKYEKENTGVVNFTDEKEFYTILDNLRKRNLTGHTALQTILDFITSFPDTRDLVLLILDRNLKIRISETVINKVFPKLIPEFKCQLASKFETKHMKLSVSKYFASIKKDGGRLLTVVNDGVITTFSRTGKEFTTLKLVSEAVRAEVMENGTIPYKNFVLDGEICIVDENGKEDFTAIMKVLKKKDYTIENPKYIIFDIIPYDDFIQQHSTISFSDRYDIYKQIVSPSGILSPLEQVVVKSEEHLNEMFDSAVSKGLEGLIVKKDGDYEGKRTKNLLKMKKFFDKEFKIVDFETGPFRYIDYDEEGTAFEKEEILLTNVKIKFKNNLVGVGSGFSLDERKKYKDGSIVGKVITVAYFEESKNQEGIPSLRFPTVKYIHGEKREV